MNHPFPIVTSLVYMTTWNNSNKGEGKSSYPLQMKSVSKDESTVYKNRYVEKKMFKDFCGAIVLSSLEKLQVILHFDLKNFQFVVPFRLVFHFSYS